MIKSSVTISLVPSLRGGPWIFWDTLEISVPKARAIGFDAIELFTASADAVNPDSFAALLEKNELELAAVGTGAAKVIHHLTLTSPDQHIREKALRYARDMIAFGGRFRAPTIIGSIQGVVTEDTTRLQVMTWLRDALCELSDVAAEHDAKLILEPLNRYETNVINRLSDAAALVDSLQVNNVILLADLFHMNIEEKCLSATLREFAHYIGYLHFADSNRWPAGMGHIDMKKVGRVLGDIGFDGYVSAEALPYPDPDSAATQTMSAFRNFLLTAYSG